jgi:2-dehydro-3-deoxygluconokinase
MQISEFPWDLLPRAGWLHLTGITCALSESCRSLVNTAMLRAHEHGLTVSFDVNYRARLWSPKQASEALEPLCRETDMLIVKQADAASVFASAGDAETMVRNLGERFARQVVVLTCGSAGALALDKARNQLTHAPAFPVAHTVDRIGAGDAFDAGFIAGYMQGGCERGLRMGNAMAALKMTIPGDMALISRDEVERLVADGATGINR